MNTIARTLMTILACAAILASTAEAQNSGRQPGQGHRPPKPPIDTVLDANSDEIVDADEIANASAAITTLDSDGDGTLTADECLPRRRQRPGGQDRRGQSSSVGTNQPGQGSGQGGEGHRPPQPPIFTALDADGDGLISADEIANAPATLSSLDKDGDGSLTATEYRPPHPGRRGGPGGGDGRGGQDNSR